MAPLRPSGYAGHLASLALRAMQDGGAGRDRTDDLKLAKLALSQLSYGPVSAGEAQAPASRTSS